MENKYRTGDVVVIGRVSIGRVRPNEIGIIKEVGHFPLYPYTVHSISNDNRYDYYTKNEIKHIF